MNRREAKRLVCLGAAAILESGPNLWLGFAAGGDGAKLRDSDPDCLDEPVEELWRRGGE